jgi:hypothetical protein
MAEKPQTLRSRSALPLLRLHPKGSTARSLVKFAGTWVGGDLEKRLAEAYTWRARARFDYLPPRCGRRPRTYSMNSSTRV